MSDLDIALWKRIIHIVKMEGRSFSYLDFVPTFKVDEKEFTLSHGTFRNKVSYLLRLGEIAHLCYSPQAFYTIAEVKVSEPIRVDRIGVLLPAELKYIKNDPFYRSVKNLPFGQKSLHNIRLRFKANGIWSALLSHDSDLEYKSHPISKDIPLPVMNKDSLCMRVSIHRKDTVSVIIGCSESPVAVDVDGVIRLSNALAEVKERLEKMLGHCNSNSNTSSNGNTVKAIISDYTSWIVTMWHFGADVLADYKGKANYRRWGIAEKILITIYTKEWEEAKRRIRWDCQEYPGIPLKEAFQQKLNAIIGVG
jgi:hypothetical protein